MRNFTNRMRVKVNVLGHCLNGKVGTVQRIKISRPDAWIRFDEPVPDDVRRFPVGDERANDVVFAPEDCVEVTGMRHEWQHPAFAKSDGVGSRDPECESKRKLEEIASELDVTYSALMRDADRWLDSDGDWEGYTTQHGSETWRDVMYNRKDEFWKHYAIVTGKAVPEAKKENFYSCSC